MEQAKEEIPFCTHDDLMKHNKADIEAIGMITCEADEINYDKIKENDGIDFEGNIIDNSDFSLKKKSKSKLDYESMKIDYNMSISTIKRNLKRLEQIHIGNEIPLIYVNKTNDDIVYEVNHKTFGNKYVLIDKRILRKLLFFKNGSALKLYLVIKYNYEYCQKQNKPCILTMDYLRNTTHIKSRSQISDLLWWMKGKLLNIETFTTHEEKVVKGKVINEIRKHNKFEVIKNIDNTKFY